MTYNLWIDNPKVEAIQQSIQHENPEILFLCEIPQNTMSHLRSQLDYPYNYRTTKGNTALFSRYPIIEAKTNSFGLKTPNPPHLVAKVQLEDEIITLIGIHLLTPLRQKTFHIRNQNLDALISASRKIDGKLIVLGDFNTTPWSPYFQRFERKSQLTIAGRRQWIWATWYFNRTLQTRYIKIPIDHIATRGFKAVKTWTGMTGGSDHKPLITVLRET
jgi:endonuclease/exonuclease/phosphatase (EEP) superfamily protein YafD